MMRGIGAWTVLSVVAVVWAGSGACREPDRGFGEVSPAPSGEVRWRTDMEPLVRSVELKVGESQEVVLSDGSKATVKLLGLEETHDELRSAVRQARVRVEVNGEEAVLTSGTYNLPVPVGGVQIDCPITKGYLRNSRGNPWSLASDARIRLWPGGSAWMKPGTFAYPLRQRWFAGATQMGNEPCYVDGVERPGTGPIYYHYGLDFGGAEGLEEVLSATDGLVTTAGTERLAEYEGKPGSPRYDTVTVVDRRGWFYRYSHLQSVEVKVGQTVKMGQRIGVLGKEGDSGGWSHLHFDISSPGPSGTWRKEDAYAFAWEAYRREHGAKVVAVARPHHLAWAGQAVVLDGSKSWSAGGPVARYEWTFTDGSTAAGATVERTYAKAGEYSEILKVTDGAGRTDYDFAVVQVIDKSQPGQVPPGLHLAHWPTLGIKAGDPVTFKVRCFGTTHGEETIDFGDGTAAATTQSDGCVEALAKEGYATVVHRFAKAGQYVVTARRSDARGLEAVMRVAVRVGGEK